MKPFSAWMYISRNKARSIVLSLMMACVTVCFIGGMYVDNPLQTFEVVLDKPSDYAVLGAGSGNTEIMDEFRELAAHVKDYPPECADTILPVHLTHISFKSIMGFDNFMPMVVFVSADDFTEFKRVTDCVPDEIALHDGELVLSRTLANNWGVAVGDVLEYEQGEWDKADFYYQPMTVKEIIDIPGTVLYGVGEQFPRDCAMILRSEPSSVQGYDEATVQNALSDMIDRVLADYPHTEVVENARFLDTVRDELSMMTAILGGITLMVGLVLAVTVNATFAAAYDKRKYEFSIYKAIGFSDLRIFGKIASEVLLLNGLGLAAGMAVCGIVVFVVNYLCAPSGVGFVKVSADGLAATVICDLMVLIPVILLNWKRVRKCDVTVW